MANLETETMTSNTSGDQYQVFLSFRGSDTGRGFTSSLYNVLVEAGIRVFINDEDLRLGERINDNLERAINDSRFYIPIFSRNYASSSWCLQELVKIVENKSQENGEKSILPIFYDVTPDDVKLKTPLYLNDIMNLEQKFEGQKKNFDSKEVETWRQALKEVSNNKGLEREKGDGDLIKCVVQEVLVKLNIRQRQVTKNLVGMKDHIAAINNLLDSGSSGAQVIVIHGTGGIGKTTLAKIIFNQLCPRFEKCSFLDDVREKAKTKNGLVELKKKLLFDISGSTVARNIGDIDDGINMIGVILCNKKALIVLDDVDTGKQIQYLVGGKSLCAGTIIIVTTRDQTILNTIEFEDEFKAYEMVPLSDKDALELFCRHAFGDNSPPADYYTLSEKIVDTTEGLPLAIEVIGSSLFGVEKEVWEEKLEKLKETRDKDVLGRLRIVGTKKNA